MIVKGWFKEPICRYIRIGNDSAAEILAKETILYRLRTNKKTPNDANPTSSDNAKNIPSPVATAFPPLPLSQIGHI